MNLGAEIFKLLKMLFPIHRSITGEGVRETLRVISEIVPLNIVEVPSGTEVYDWIIPDEWSVNEAYIEDYAGNRIVDIKNSNLHIVGYSDSFSGEIKLDDLREHMFTIPESPDWIPYVTSYYKKMWGFCLRQSTLDSMTDDTYNVVIDSSFKSGSMTYGELLIKGTSEYEIMISANICHPSMANNELSGPVIATYLARELMNMPNLRYSYRFVFIPETIGSIAYIHRNLDSLKKNVKAGYTITCAGDRGDFSYLPSKCEQSFVNRITTHVLRETEDRFNMYNFSERGSDERQYCSPGVDLPIGSLMRSKYGEYPEYHTSADNLSLVSESSLGDTFNKYMKCFESMELNKVYKVTTLCEPHLGAHGLYPTTSTGGAIDKVRITREVLMYSDGVNDLLTIAEIINKPIWEVAPIANKLVELNLLSEVT